MSETDNIMILAYDRGYRVVGGEVISPHTLKPRKLYISNTGYPAFSYRKPKGEKFVIKAHRMVAYQKYGDKMFQGGLQVRHLDGDKMNFSEDNIVIGTASENMMDIPKPIRERVQAAATRAASRVNRKWSRDMVRAIRNRHNETKSYKIVMEEFSISSKGTLYYILNHTYLKETE